MLESVIDVARSLEVNRRCSLRFGDMVLDVHNSQAHRFVVHQMADEKA